MPKFTALVAILILAGADAAAHDIYESWHVPGLPKSSCCHGEDCRPTTAYMGDDGHWRAKAGNAWLMAGHGRADKEQMIAAAIAMGVEVADHHQADALAVALCAYEHVGIAVRGHDGPLLAPLSRWAT